MKIFRSIRFKFLCCLLGVSILPILIVFGVMVNNNMKFYNTQISMASDGEVKRMVLGINSTFSNLEELLTSLIFSQYDNDSCILSICQQEGEQNTISKMQRLYNYRKFEYVSSNLIGNNQYAEGVYLFTESGYTYSFAKNREFWLEENYQQANWYRNLLNSEDFQIVESYQGKGSRDRQILLARRFTDIKGKNMGILAVVCNDKMFDTVGDSSLPWGQSFIMDSEGKLLNKNDVDINLAEADIPKMLNSDSGMVFRKDTNHAFIFGTLKINDWKIVSEVSFESQRQLYLQNMCYLMMLIAAIVLFVILLVYIFWRIFLKPLIQLSNSMKETPLENMYFKNTYEERKDEIGILYRRFEKMIAEINLLIKDKYVGEIKYLKSRLQNLMSQINAHFIFNTLENINSLAQIEKNTQIGIMSKSLGDMLRYSIEYEEDEEKLKVEIGHIRSYIKIQEIRFGSPIDLQIDAEPEILESLVLKFMLQPIIENAIEHGLAGEELPWTIILKAFRQEKELMVEIFDNGVGMEAECLEKVRRRIYHPEELSEDSRYENIGLYNIYQRIKLLYLSDYGLEVDSLQGVGTTVRVRLPFREELCEDRREFN